jgi:hypothetical protein
MNADRCVCGHVRRNHIDGHGLCLVESCKKPLCLVFRSERKAAA